MREKSAPLNRIPATDVTQILNINLHDSHSHCDVIQKTLASVSAGAGGLNSAADGGCDVLCCMVGGVTPD